MTHLGEETALHPWGYFSIFLADNFKPPHRENPTRLFYLCSHDQNPPIVAESAWNILLATWIIHLTSINTSLFFPLFLSSSFLVQANRGSVT
jgi:hypothetical protein